MPDELVTVTTHKRRKRQPKAPLSWLARLANWFFRPLPAPRATRKPRQPRASKSPTTAEGTVTNGESL